MEKDVRTLLRKATLRATPKRLALLKVLEKAHAPMTAEEIHMKLSEADLVTIYRNLQSLVDAGLVREVRFKDASVRYESAAHGHHHHVVCTHCGMVDELPQCDVRTIEKHALKNSRRFVSISEHALEFFGMCTSCAKR